MDSHIVAKEKIKGLTARLEKSLYKLRYGDKPTTVMSEDTYYKVKSICEGKYPFPLKRICGEVFVNCGAPEIYCTLNKLADSYNIIFDVEKVVH